MPEVLDQIVCELRERGGDFYPERHELRNVRVVGHTPKSNHYIYDLVVDFGDGGERLAAKIYRGSKLGSDGARNMARLEAGNLQRVYAAFQKKRLNGVPRPVGDFTELGAVVTEKLVGLPFQSIIMKAALLPGYADRGTLEAAARQTGTWLRSFHRATAEMPEPFEPGGVIRELEELCDRCRGQGLDDGAVHTILSGARNILARTKKALPSSAVLNEFTPLSVVVGEYGVGISDFAKMKLRGSSLHDAALFLASVEALEKYPFCNRAITGAVHDEFLEGYGANQGETAVLRVLKMKALLAMFAQGRSFKESAMRKKVMWATVMKRFIQQAAQRSLAPAA